MDKKQDKETAQAREELARLLATLKHNREKVPLDVLKTKYKKGYAALCADIKRMASGYAAKTVLDEIRIHRDCLGEAIPIINGTIERSGILKQLSRAAFSHQDMAEFDALARILREKILADLEPFYARHLALYITQECLENPDTAPLIYCAASHCFWQDGKWVPLELYKPGSAHPQEKSA
ncbi:MAG: hypothetical protein NC306_14405 [Butyrivibrio sp.]|nr:hypothetical protein [Butyrivibrio sp.]